jgi:uncharacterized protein (DUF1330 family)
MAAYLIANVDVTDPAAYDAYRSRVAPLVAKFGGRFLVRGGEHAVLEGAWQPRRLVVIEFPSMESLRAWYGSDEYAPLIALRKQAASGDLVAVEGT